MRIERLRPAHAPEKLAEIYAEPHDHRRYGHGHHVRVEETIKLAKRHLPAYHRRSVADLSCGNGEIARRICTNKRNLHLGDFAEIHPSAPIEAHTGPIEETIGDIPEVNVFVLSETLEHLDDPQKVLSLIRSKAQALVLTTPLECWLDSNQEHYWAWDRAGVEHLMKNAAWIPRHFATVDSRSWGEPYLYGIWIAS